MYRSRSVRHLLLVAMFALWLPFTNCCAADLLVRYPKLAFSNDPQVPYFIELLHLGLRNSGKTYQVVSTAVTMQQAGVIREMTSLNGQVDVFWSMSTDAREADLVPVRIPLDKGLIGWRVALLAAGKTELFQSTKSLVDLRKFKAGQESGWPDLQILSGNGIPVVSATSEEAMFSMLTGGRFDYFPRSVIEINRDLQLHPKLALEVDQRIALHYPSAVYFFVSPHRPEIAEDLRRGLEVAIADGSYERLFQQYLQPDVARFDIKHRHIIELINPLLSINKMPLHRQELWFYP